ncbi:MAG TPA: HAD family hydrolase, partial [Anaerolineales bacterium]|nr:HAD family hydrolase [Anaerolineales bacterium]
ATGLINLLEERMTTEQAGRQKPHPHGFQRIARRLGVEPEESVFVGDLLKDDILGAQSAGMRAVWVKRKETPLDHMIPDATIHELAELLPVLDGWYPGWRM